MKKSRIIRNLQSNLNEYKTKKWFKKENCKYKKVWDKIEPFEVDNVQGHFGYNDNSPHKLYVNIRGSDEKADWAYNWKFFLKSIKKEKAIRPYNNMNKKSKIKVHRGFLALYLKVREMLIEKVCSYDDVEIIGHSLGSAIGILFALDVEYRGILTSDHITVFPFSMPKVGNSHFVKSYNKRILNTHGYYLDGDIVVKNPPWIFGYREIEKMIPVDKLNYFLPWNWWAGLIGVSARHYPNKVLDKIKKLL